MFRVTLLPALQGDCLWVEYGNPASPRRILIDGGPIGAYPALERRINALPEGEKALELAVISHVDGDHIEGMIRLIAEKNRDIVFKDIWFNGWKHLTPESEILGAMQGEFLSALIHYKIGDDRWNAAKAFAGKAIEVTEKGELPKVVLAGCLQLTLLSPTRSTLDTLRKEWKGKVPTDFTPGDVDAALDQLEKQKRLTPKGILGGVVAEDAVEPVEKVTANNGSSIAFLAEFAEKRCLFLADASPKVVAASIRRLVGPGERLKVDAVKVSHHGSGGNTTNELLDVIDCKRFLISTNGSGKPRHPHERAIRKILDRSKSGVELYFNHDSPTTRVWGDAARQKEEGYTAHFPSNVTDGIALDL